MDEMEGDGRAWKEMDEEDGEEQEMDEMEGDGRAWKEEDGEEHEDESDEGEIVILEAQLVEPPTGEAAEAESRHLCPICQDELEEEGWFLSPRQRVGCGVDNRAEDETAEDEIEPWGMTPCGHAFHYRCISGWLQETTSSVAKDHATRNFQCPVCRHGLPRSSMRMMRNEPREDV